MATKKKVAKKPAKKPAKKVAKKPAKKVAKKPAKKPAKRRVQARRSARAFGPVVDVNDSLSDKDLEASSGHRTPVYTRKTVRTVNIKNGDPDTRNMSVFDRWK